MEHSAFFFRVLAVSGLKVNSPSTLRSSRSVPFSGSHGLDNTTAVGTVADEVVEVLLSAGLITEGSIGTDLVEVVGVVNDVIRVKDILLQQELFSVLNSVLTSVANSREVSSYDLGSTVPVQSGASSFREVRSVPVNVLGLVSEAIGGASLETLGRVGVVDENGVQVVRRGGVVCVVHVGVGVKVGLD